MIEKVEKDEFCPECKIEMTPNYENNEWNCPKCGYTKELQKN
ncbi:hypothetical protein LCGC14_2248950 [marine sediment metagenome]|uniref:Uncharacterized protein n=1 Tax=marine sediment metagenome TaxID=412755 RepID=A0A0F9D3F8_9ZZZZ